MSKPPVDPEPWKDPERSFWYRIATAPILQMPHEITEGEQKAAKLDCIPIRLVGNLPVLTAHLCVRGCHRCPTLVKSFDFLNDDEVVCERCGEDVSRRGVRQEKLVDAEHFRRRLDLTGLSKQARIIETLRLMAENPEPDIEAGETRFLVACMTARRYLKAAQRGLLILSGFSGTGKSTAAAWAVFRTHGLFMPRSEWTKVQVRGRDSQRLEWLIEHGGVVVLDDACVVRPGGTPGDSDWESEVVFQVAQARHEANRGTVITTQGEAGELENAYGTRGEALVRRANQGLDLSGAPEGGGWVDCGGTDDGWNDR